MSDCIWHCKFSLLLYQYVQAGLLYWNHVSKCHHVCNVAFDNLCSCETSWNCGIDANPVNMNFTTNIFSQQLANGYRNSRNTHWPSEDSLHPDQPLFFAPSAYFFVCLIWTWLEGPVRHYCILKKRLKVLEWHFCKHSVQLGYIGLYHESLLTMYFRDQNERLTIYMFNMATTLIIDLSYLGTAFCEIDWFHHTKMPRGVNDTCRLIWSVRLFNVPIETADLCAQRCYCCCRSLRLWEMIYRNSAEEISNEIEEILQRV